MLVDDGFIRDTLTGLMAIVAAIMSFFMRGLVKKIESNSDDLQAARLDIEKANTRLADYKTEVAQTYAKDQSVQQSLARIHQRLDALPHDIIEQLHMAGNKA